MNALLYTTDLQHFWGLFCVQDIHSNQFNYSLKVSFIWKYTKYSVNGKCERIEPIKIPLTNHRRCVSPDSSWYRASCTHSACLGGSKAANDPMLITIRWVCWDWEHVHLNAKTCCCFIFSFINLRCFSILSRTFMHTSGRICKPAYPLWVTWTPRHLGSSQEIRVISKAPSIRKFTIFSSSFSRRQFKTWSFFNAVTTPPNGINPDG